MERYCRIAVELRDCVVMAAGVGVVVQVEKHDKLRGLGGGKVNRVEGQPR